MFVRISKKNEKFDLYKTCGCKKKKKQHMNETSKDTSNSYDAIKENVSNDLSIKTYRK